MYQHPSWISKGQRQVNPWEWTYSIQYTTFETPQFSYHTTSLDVDQSNDQVVTRYRQQSTIPMQLERGD